MNLTIDELKNAGCFSDIDIHLAEFLSSVGGVDSPVFHLTIMMLSSRLSSGDVCLSLGDIAGKPLSYFFGYDDAGILDKIIIPGKNEIIDSISKSRAVSGDGKYLPLILDAGDKLYFQK